MLCPTDAVFERLNANPSGRFVPVLGGYRAVVDLELIAKRAHPDGGESYVQNIIDGCVERLGDLDEREAIIAEGNGLLDDEPVIDGDAIEIPF